MHDMPEAEPARRIISHVPHPASRTFIEELSTLEPHSMSGFSPVVWHRAEGFQVWDAYGNKWIDFTSAVVLANAGHANPRIRQAIIDQLDQGLWHSYCNPSDIRLRTVKALAEISPPYLDKVFLLTTGSEANECAIKLMRIHGRRQNPDKIHILSYDNSFHGRTMASQAAGGYPDQQEWMGQKPPGFHHIPFPECPRCPWGKARYDNCGRQCLERSLRQLEDMGVQADLLAGVITETFQGPIVAFMPLDYVAALREWTSQHNILLAFDEIQAGFGRTGKWFGFEHYAVEPDLVCVGKGMTSCLPMSAVIGRGAILDLPEHGEMSSTHTGNPLCCAAAIANIAAIRDDGLLQNAAALEDTAREALLGLRRLFPRHVGAINGRGLVWAVYLLDPVTGQLDPDLGTRVTTRCMELGLLMLQTGRGTLKIAPPLCISREAFLEGVQVIREALAQSLRSAA
jgi:4-aminobutyrate aminotransferase/(S)-3-amino-2-methylpropionate transaminase